MTDTLFPESDLYEGDPVRPDTETVTPADVVARLTRPDRERRLRWLTDQAFQIHETGIAEHLNDRELVAQCVLFSGGNDSTTLAHLFRGRATHAVHANTTVGIEETRQYVRDTCAGWGLPLVEEFPPDTYRDLILGDVYTRAGEPVWAPGFPGPAAHGFMYARLKERALDKARHTLGIANSTRRAAVYIAGRRRSESKRRTAIPLHEPDGSVIWTSPLAMWTKVDMNTYRLVHDDVPRNRVSDLIHMSGECLCGAFGHPGELEEIRYWFPDVAAELDALGAEALARGIDPRYCTWGHGQRKPTDVSAEPTAGRLCETCAPPLADLFTEETP